MKPSSSLKLIGSTRALGTVKIVVNNVEEAKDYVIPFKSFFHELGHAIDFFAGSGNKFLSIYFRYTSYEFIARTELSDSTIARAYDSKGEQAKIIHEWAANDVRNELYEVGIDFLNDPANLQSFQITAQDKQDYLKIVIEDYFFSGIGWAKYDLIKNSNLTRLKIIKEIYDGIQIEISNRLTDQDNISNLAKDIYGG